MKKKLNLKDLKVSSFVTSVEGKSEETIKGGGPVVVGSALCSAVCTATTCPVVSVAVACTLHTKLRVVCEGWYTIPPWQGCGSF